MAKNSRKRYNRMVITIASVLVTACLVFIGLLLNAANERSYLVVFVLAFVLAILIIFFTAKDMLK